MTNQSTPPCPKCTAPTVKRNGGRGAFWACTRYPDCKGSMDYFEYVAGQDLADCHEWVRARKAYGLPISQPAPVRTPVVRPAFTSPALVDEHSFDAAIQARDAAEERQRMDDKMAMEKQANAKRPKQDVAAMLAKAQAGGVEIQRKFEASIYQQAIFNWVTAGVGNALVVEALAGSGKTTTGVEMLKLIPFNLDVLFVAFNAHIADTLRKRAPKHVKVQTYHSVGYAICRKAFGQDIKIDEDKVWYLIEEVLDKQTYKHIFPAIKHIVSLIKANLLDASAESLDYIVEHYCIEINGDRDLIYNAVPAVLARSANMTKMIDYDDMCWMPVFYGLPAIKYDFVFVDEAQDTNKNQIALALMSLKEGGRIVAVGDRYQSLYGFRGADVDAIPNLISSLEAEVLPLSITYRNPRLVVEMVRREFAYIPLEAAPNAQDGIIKTVSESQALVDYVPGDMVLCRTNAPLVKPAFALIRRGVKALIRGRDIGKGLVELIKKMKADTISELLTKLTDYSRKEVTKLMDANKSTQAQALQDKVDTIVALTDGIDTLPALEMRIGEIFSDKVEGVVFSSVHRSKGLEAKRVFILHPELMPHPMAKQEWEQRQEQNIKYVAYTRTLETLVFVTPE